MVRMGTRMVVRTKKRHVRAAQLIKKSTFALSFLFAFVFVVLNLSIDARRSTLDLVLSYPILLSFASCCS